MPPPEVSHLSPPVVDSPIYECAEAVHVSGYVPQAILKVYATKSGVEEVLANVVTTLSFMDVTLSRPAKFGETISATQEANGVISLPSIQPVLVIANSLAIKSTKPVVSPILYQCGQVVTVDKLIPGVRLHVYENGTQVANVPVAETWDAVLTPPLLKNGIVTVQEFVCEGSGHSVAGQVSDVVSILNAPSPVPPPKPEAASMIPGNNIVTLSGLLVGARIEIFDKGLLVASGWWANSDRNWFTLNTALTSTSKITATQKLCDVSAISDGVLPTGTLPPLIVLGPICPKSRFVVIRGSTIGATVLVQRATGPGGPLTIATAGAAPGDLVIGLGNGEVLEAGYNVFATQYVGPTTSPYSNTITVAGIPQPIIEILGGDPFFLPKGGEQPIIGPVFPRGRGNGPVFRVQACCSKDVHAEIRYPHQKITVATLDLTELFPGYFIATWPWTSTNADWPSPNGIPVGMYDIKVTSACSEVYSEIPFFVIFNPEDVGGPSRFSFDDTAVWFSPGGNNNSATAHHYALHQSDFRIFFSAIQHAEGNTDPFDAALAVATIPDSTFTEAYKIQSQDTIDLISNFDAVGSADYASYFIALLRAIGIPAYPVTGLNGHYRTFDTWVEFLADLNGKRDWWAIHRRTYPGMLPESRPVFGTRPNSTRDTFDLIFMANENWVSSQLDAGGISLQFDLNSCQRPEQTFFETNYVDELCEKGYWSIPHWDCSGARKRLLNTEGFIVGGDKELAFGGRISGSLKVANGLKERTSGTIVVDVIVSAPESNRTPGERVDTTTTHLALEHGESSALAFDLKLPTTLAPGHDLSLWAHIDGLTIALHPLVVTPGVTCKITEPTDTIVVYRLGEHSTISATITNTSKQTLKGANVKLNVPFSLSIAGEVTRQLGVLEPGKSHDLIWKVEAVAPARSGSFKVSVATANAGSVLVHHPFQIPAPPPVFEVSPATAARTAARK